MKRVIPILVITVWLLQAVTINVNAAPFVIREKLQTPPPIVDLGDDPSIVIYNADEPSQDGAKNVTVTGDGTELVIVEGTAVSHCREFFGFYFCTNTDFNVEVVNNNGEALTLNACAVITIEDHPGVAKFFWDDEGPSGFGANAAVPFADCVQYGMDIDETFVVGLRSAASPTTSVETFTFHYVLYLSYSPISTCDTEPVSLTSDTYEIDPLIETPLGPTGTPADDQIYTTVTGEPYHITTAGTWDDGTVANREDAAISWDGVTWTPLISVPAICVESNGNDASRYITAESDTLYIRSNDTVGDFADNSANLPPYTYTIELVYMGASCESQYTYDSFTDSVGFVGVPSTNADGVLANNADIPLVVGDWYVVRWNYGEWMEGGLTHKDLQYKMALNWEPLSEGSGSVWCVSTSGIEVLIQASAVDLYLRVNDQDDNFANNTGTPYYDLYHVTFTRAPEMCETSIVLGDLIEHKTVNGNQSGGVPFAQMVGGSIASIGLEPGGIYVVDTVEGPWWQVATNPFNRYDLAVTEDASTWVPLEEWARPTCNVATDALGHRRVIFQMPSAGEITYSMRVNATGAFFLNQGAMSWDLYGARSASEPVNTCFDGLSLQVLNEFERVGSLALGPRDELGSALAADTARYTEFIALTVGNSYAVEIPVNNERWTDGTSTTGRSDAAISKDNGVTWHDILDDGIDGIVDCYKTDAIGTNTIKFTVADGDVWKIRVNDTDGAFDDNGGSLAYKFYGLCEGMSCTASIPNDSTTNSIPAITVQGGGNVCTLAVMRPGPLAVSELLSVGNYIGSWVQYINLSVLRYMAWCPVHTNLLTAYLEKFKTVEPLATVYEWMENFKRIRTQISTYDWGDRGGSNFSLFDVRSSSQLNTLINDNVFPSGNNSVWDRGKLISFGQGTSLPDAYYSCGSALTERIPASLKMGVCFVSAYFVETSASFWIQIALDIGAFFMLIGFLKSSIQEIIYMLTGVKPWTKSGANASIEKLTDYFERENRNAEIERASRINGLTNKYWDYRKR